MRGTIDDILKQKYDEVKVPEGLINFKKLVEKVEMPGAKKRKKKKRIIITSLILAILLCGATILGIILTTDKPEKIIPSSYVAEVEVNNNHFDFVEKSSSDSIYSVKVDKILEYSMVNVGGVKYPITKIRANVLNTILGKKMENIEFWIPGGICSVKELNESGLKYEKEIVSNLSDDEQVKINYTENVDISSPVVGKSYITILYEDNGQLYIEKNLKCGFKEYNEETNQFLNDDGEWVELDLNKYL